MAVMDMYDKISSAIDNSEYSIGIFLDLSKAFDTLDHETLIVKLMHYGIRGITLELFQNYLTNRKQYVNYNNVNSAQKYITTGVPQGSILGPLLFILYVNDIVNSSVILKFLMFADDTNLFCSSKILSDLIDILNTELHNVSEWFLANKLSLNPSKTNFMIFGNKYIGGDDTKRLLILNGHSIEQVECTKFLGVYIDNKLNWKQHIQHVSSKISKAVGMINSVKNKLSKTTMLLLYHTMIYPHLTYCNIVWGCACQTELNRIVTMQKKAIRLITGSHYLSSTAPLFHNLSLLRFPEINKFQTGVFMFKYKNFLLPDSCFHYFNISNPTSCAYNTRKKLCYFTIPFSRTILRDRSVAVAGPKLWDSLPCNIQDAVNISTLKKLLKGYLINGYVLQ
jgi:Reverse transcriptase (RNA-dependent DNA polymerase)